MTLWLGERTITTSTTQQEIKLSNDWFDELERAANLDAVKHYKAVIGAQRAEEPAQTSLLKRLIVWVAK